MTPETEASIREFCATAEGQWAPVERLLETAESIIQSKPQVVVEIGVFAGRSMIPQALALKENGLGRIYGIDPWRLESAIEGENEANRDWWSKNVDLHQMHRLTVEAIWKYGLDERAIIIRAASQDAVTLFADDSIDLLTIDGCHSEVASCRDVRLYLPLVKFGGTIIFDDSDWQSTAKALSMLDACELMKDGGNYRVYRKL